MAETIKKWRPGLGSLVLTGFVLGIAYGLFFGEMASVFKDVGRAYVRLLQMAVIPYITVSLISGLGRLTPAQASRIAVWGGAVLLTILAAGMIIVLVSPLAYPAWEAASYFSSSLLSSSDSIDFVSLYITANPFDALANTIVPAIVLFSIIMGVAVMTSERKAPLLELLASLDEALMNITRFIVRLAPIGIFAISANAAGTLDISAFDKLQIYVWTYLLLFAVFFFLLLPGLLIALTPVRYREIFTTFRISFITAFVTGSVMVVLPMLIEEIKAMLKVHCLADEETDAAVDVLIPTTFNFPSVAMLLVLSFIPFSGWYAGNPLSAEQYPQFASVGLFVAFGGSNIALPFLLDMFRLPADMFQLFLVANVITNFFFSTLSAMNLVILTLLTMFLIKRRIKLQRGFLALLLSIGVFGVPLLLQGQGTLIEHLLPHEYTGYRDFISREMVIKGVKVRSADYSEGATIRQVPSRLERIKNEGWLRVGYSVDALPWVFRNASNNVVGFDMELMYQLARDLEVGLELVVLERGRIHNALATGQIDIYASGLMMDAQLGRKHTISAPYADVTLGLLVEDHRRQEFESIDQLRRNTGNSFAVLNSPSLERSLRLALPELKFSSVDSPRDFLRGEMESIDALIMSAEAASAWTLIYPDFAAVVPTPSSQRIPIVFALPDADDSFRLYVNGWLGLAKSLGISDRAYKHWILGIDVAEREARWSVIRDVLHWVD
ncbi:MAG: cation:dicarboxylase symporter family transporter [Gammaproteobacteria bacterium]|nr:MAG: cation:dicarboxylase symporter family transporter [Gammaproteobacteria bacterium]